MNVINLKNSVIILFVMALLQGLFFAGLKTKNETVTIKCEKMHCMGCKAAITEAVQQVEGVKKIDVDLKTKIIKVTFDNSRTDAGTISAKISEAGYENEIIN